MRHFLVSLTFAFFGLAAAWAAGPDPVPATLVDLDKVVESGVATPVDGISAAGQPDAKALEVFAHSGYRAVIDLRGGSESRGLDEAATVTGLGMSYVSLPITSDADISFANAAQLDAYLQSADGPVLVHCGSGNRVGALLALRKSLAGADAESAVSYGKAGGLTRLEPLVRQRLEERAAAEAGDAPPAKLPAQD